MTNNQRSGTGFDEGLRVARRSCDLEALPRIVSSLGKVESGGSRLLDLWVWGGADEKELQCLHGGQSELTWNRFAIGDANSYAGVGHLLPAAHWLERDIAATASVRPETVPPIADIRPSAGGETEPLRTTQGRGVFTIPFGPVRSGVVEAMLYDVATAGEDMLFVTVRPGFKRRHMEDALCSAPIHQVPLVAERIAGVYSVAGALVVCQAVEHATKTEVPFEAASLRTVLAELERIFNHCDSLMKLCDDASLSVGVAQMGILKERILRLLARLTGHRYGRGIVTLGGVVRGIDRDALVDELDAFSREHTHVRRALLSTESFLDRLRRTGTLSRTDGALLGASGPVARGSCLPWDARAERPYAAYHLYPVTPAVMSGGDAMARTEVRLAEMDASIDICRILARDVDLESMPEPHTVRLEPDQFGVSCVESPEGEWIASVELGLEGISHCRIRPASLLNFACFPRACEGWVLTDFAFIEHSFNLSIAGRDR